MNSRCMGHSFHVGVICSSYKKGDDADLGNYRHLSMMNTDYKILPE